MQKKKLKQLGQEMDDEEIVLKALLDASGILQSRFEKVKKEGSSAVEGVEV